MVTTATLEKPVLRSSEVAELLGLSRATVEGLSTYMGHASVTLTLDRYGHMFPGNEERRRGCSTPTSSAPVARRLARRPASPHSQAEPGGLW